MKRHFHPFPTLLLTVLLMLLLSGCGVSRFIPEGEYLLDRVSVHCDSNKVNPQDLQGYIRQHPNSRWFTLWRAPMFPYMILGNDTTKRFNRFLKRIGESPRICDTTEMEHTRRNMQDAVFNMGYLHDTVVAERTYKHKKVRINYQVHPGDIYRVSRLEFDVQDSALVTTIDSLNASSNLHLGMPFDANLLDAERTRITNELHDLGYYYFNRDFITYSADTTRYGNDIWLTMHVAPYSTAQHPQTSPHRRYHIGNVSLQTVNPQNGSLRSKVLAEAVRIRQDSLYRHRDVQDTYTNFARLTATMSPAIRFTPSPEDSSRLDCDMRLTMQKPHSVSFQLDGTNSAGDLGAAVSTSYQNRNIFHGSELLTLKLRGAFEAIKGLEGYADQNYVEYSAEARLTFPRFLLPFFNRIANHARSTSSEVSIMYNSQDRPEFHRRAVSAAWRYRWNMPKRRLNQRVDILDLNYVYMPWVSSTFSHEYLDDPTSRNAILRYNYENLFIMKSGYNLSFSSASNNQMNGNYGQNAYSIRFNVESSGNLLYGISNLFNASIDGNGHYNIFNIAYAQYAKFDFDFAKSFKFDDRNSLACHLGLGVAYPYGNSTILPYEKRYFSGGANSVRGWSVRELGPGSFKESDGRINFINQTGDIKLDLNLEYRTHLFWKFDGAAFVDAGNIWTIRNYEDQPGGQFNIRDCWRQIAVAYGLGLRLNFSYFILRLDGGMKAINPAYSDSRNHYPIIHPSFKRDFSLHFAVGLPF